MDNSNLTEIEKLIWTSAFTQYCEHEIGDCSKNDRLIATEAVRTANRILECYRTYSSNDDRIPH